MPESTRTGKAPKGRSAQDAVETFAVGQRWLSETQTELGLGLVIAVDWRVVRVAFPAIDEQRDYARHSAPLWRARFQVGDQIRDQSGEAYEVIGVEEQASLLTYLALDVSGVEHRIPETRLDPHLQINRPQQRLKSGRLDRDVWFQLRARTHAFCGRWNASEVRGLVGPRISPIPHQLHIAHEVAARWAPRVLLADEVGLGKTIEAGLILHRLLLEGRVQRVLVLAPETLLHQWLVELLRRFGLRFSLFDADRLAATQGNPFESEQRVLCSLELLTDSPLNAAAALGVEWDLLIVDEAHHLHWTPEDSGLDYDLVEALSEQIPAVLLLTATPEQFGRAGHFGRLRLLDPQRFGDYQAFLAEEEDYAPVADLAAALLDGVGSGGSATESSAGIGIGGAASAESEGVHDPDAFPFGLDAARATRLQALLGEISHLNREQVLARLLDRHGTSRVLFRNRRASIPGFPARKVFAHPLTPPADYSSADPGLPAPERGESADWVERDPRVGWLLDWLRAEREADSGCKVLLIAAHAETVMALRAHLFERAGLHAAVFHEQMEIIERDRAAAFFADAEEGSPILLCSEIGSEGRNFQFAHRLVLFDLPLDPELLEQRIGRLDRIGQTRDIQIHIPYLTGTAGEVLYRWYDQGLDALSRHCPSGAAVRERLGDRLTEALQTPALADALIEETRGLREQLNAELEAGRDRLLELGSCRPDLAEPLVEAIESEDRDAGLFEYMAAFWDAFGVEHEPGPGGSLVLHPGTHMLEERFPGLPDEGLTLTFSRAHALAHEDRDFLTWEHPMVRQAMEMLRNSGLGTASVLLRRDPRFKAGSLLLELLHVAECPAPRELQAPRFLPPNGLHLLLDERGRDRADELGLDAVSGKCLTSNRTLSRAVLESKAESINQMLAAGEALAKTERERLRAEAIARMDEAFGARLERLEALAKVNPSIRADELDGLALARLRLREALGRMTLRLDAVRLIVHA